MRTTEGLPYPPPPRPRYYSTDVGPEEQEDRPRSRRFACFIRDLSLRRKGTARNLTPRDLTGRVGSDHRFLTARGVGGRHAQACTFLTKRFICAGSQAHHPSCASRLAPL